MTLTVEEDFDGFVAARWPDLEAVAVVATLDAPAAREATATALASLRTRWAATLEEGSPTASARRALLEAVRPRSRPRRSGPDGTSDRSSDRSSDGSSDTPAEPVAPAVLHDLVADPGSSVPGALLDALAGLPVPVRGLLAAGPLWEATDGELLGLVGPDGPSPAELDDGRSRLLHAHRGARAADGLAVADHLLEHDLADLVHRLATVSPEPPDPAGLVVERVRRLRRRTLVLGGGAVLAAGAVGWAVLERAGGPAVTAPRPSAGPTTPGPDDPAWARSSRWAPRGGLARDLGIQALIARTGARLLWADDLADLRVVLAATLGDDRPDSTVVRAWTGPPGTPGERLVEAGLAYDAVLGVEDVVAVGLDRPGGAVLVVLTRPTEGSASFSPVVRPTPAGSVEREFTTLGLANGVGTMLLPARWGAAARLRCADYDGAPLAARTWEPGGVELGTGDPLADLMATVASSTGIRVGDLRGDVLVDSPTDGSVLDPTAVSATGGDGRAVLTRVRTPAGAVVRRLDVRDDGRSGASTFLVSSTAVVPAELAGEPAVLRLDDSPEGTGRFLVVVPGGGATCRLVATGRGRSPASEAARMKRRTAVVSVPDVERTSDGLRLVVQDAAGRTTYDDVPPDGRDLAGYDDGTGWLGLPLPY
ncbi:hypothetical protein G7075_13880 [Phycicoccus sp. HDW14]|uniref:hypothetical protein n=1 Tax=Phycicoccus sp. HDW14 TaxID=2714941 RepID=UPI00140B3305|nr:hypothetical protein [Phycicoccus sp. HDW14]QIM21967.1 hypothetical protein G7075_13880 [Phycicoccus sp. HDW14]